ncbi:MAG TPA: chemotaxis protein CheB [Mycobacteriales bacterium]|nr:chemotaxis protein CheB [Mycobacteriales bacterium]
MPDGALSAAAAAAAGRPAAKVSVLLVDESATSRRQLRSALQATDEFVVVSEARSCREAVALVEQFRPSTVLMHLGAPVAAGLDAIEQIMAARPTPIVVYSDERGTAGGDNAVMALSAGAIEVVARPGLGSTARLDEYADDLRRLLRAASRIRVITHPRGRLRTTIPANGAAPAGGAGAGGSSSSGPAPNGGAANGTAANGVPGRASPPSRASPTAGLSCAPASGGRSTTPAPGRPLAAPTGSTVTKPSAPHGPIRLVAIGASTGGPHALSQILGAFPVDFEPAVLVVQHMADGFIPGLVSWLDSVCAMQVVIAEPGRRLAPGVISVAPSGSNLLVRDTLRTLAEPPRDRQFHVPGIDVAFSSIAEVVGAESIGVLLTGMGRDGAAGLKALRETGATTIGQDEATSAVYGMPAVAWTLGAVEHQLPLGEIAAAVVRLVRGQR